MAVSKDNSDKQGDAAERANDVQAEAADVERQKSEIPKFDLAEEIMAEQRKITAIKRKAPPKAGIIEAGIAGPGKKAEAPSRESGIQSIRYTIQPPPTLSEQEQIIAEIVARDIEKLCGRFDA